MEQDNKKEDSKGFLAKVKENTEDEIQILGTFVRLGVVVWSGFIITLNYVDLPMIKRDKAVVTSRSWLACLPAHLPLLA